MSVLSMKFNDEEMERILSELLAFPDETITAGVYCTFQDTGFFASASHITAGYVGLTSRGRLVGLRAGMLSSEQINMDLNCMTKIKIKKGLLGSRTVYLECLGGGTDKVKFIVTPRISGQKITHQQENFEILMGELEGRAHAIGC